MPVNKPAPKFLNLFLIKLPAGGIVSIAHRISGMLMFLATPFVAWLFALSLQSSEGFDLARAWLESPIIAALTVLLVWSLSHHLLAGVRHLLLDVEIGMNLSPARATAWVVDIGALLLTALYVVSLL
jgi:succinate dehydrogenase / fumarate reductase cytochrome b subunit